MFDEYIIFFYTYIYVVEFFFNFFLVISQTETSQERLSDLIPFISALGSSIPVNVVLKTDKRLYEN